MARVPKIKGVGNIQVATDGTIIKDCFQTVSGSAYMKIAGFIIAMYNAGYTDIIIRLNRDHPYLQEVTEHINFMTRYIPNLRADVI